VHTPIKNKLAISAGLRPWRSPNMPNNRPPSGRVTKPTPYVINDKSTPVAGATSGKNTRSKTSAAAEANAKKSYHSIMVPIELDHNRRRVPRAAELA
jgi:hypothetical protein